MDGRQEWLDFVKYYQNKTGLPWKEAMKQSGGEYRHYQIERILSQTNPVYGQPAQKGRRRKNQQGGFNIFGALGGNQIDQLINAGIKLVGENKFFGLDPKTITNLVKLVLETGKSAGTLTEVLTVIKQNPYATQIAQIPFTNGPAGVQQNMQQILAAIDAEPNGADIYAGLCAIYRTVLSKTSMLFLRIVGSVGVGSGETKANFQNRVVRAIQSLNYNALATEYNSLPLIMRQLVEDPTNLQTIIEQSMAILASSNSGLRNFIQNNLYPVVNSTIEAIRRILPITFATIILLERCGGLPAEDIEMLNQLITPTSSMVATPPGLTAPLPVVLPVAPPAIQSPTAQALTRLRQQDLQQQTAQLLLQRQLLLQQQQEQQLQQQEPEQIVTDQQLEQLQQMQQLLEQQKQQLQTQEPSPMMTDQELLDMHALEQQELLNQQALQLQDLQQRQQEQLRSVQLVGGGYRRQAGKGNRAYKKRNTKTVRYL